MKEKPDVCLPQWNLVFVPTHQVTDVCKELNSFVHPRAFSLKI